MAVRERISILASKDAKLKDNVNLWFGDGTQDDNGDLGDVKIRWDGTNLDMLPTTDDSQFYLGDGTSSFDLRVYGSSANAYISFDASADDLKFEDSVSLMFGTGAGAGQGNAGDVEIRWDATDLDILAAANNSVIKIGNGTNSFDIWLYGSSANAYISFDASADDLKFEDSVSLMFGTGAGAGPGNAGDVEIRWDGTDLDILATTDDSIIKLGNGTQSFDLWLYGNSATSYISWDASADQLKFEDNVALHFGTGAGGGPGNAGDATILFDATRLVLTPLAAGGIVHVGDGADTTANELHVFDGGTNKAGRLVLYDHAGVANYLWIDSTGDLRFDSTSPSNDTSGTIIGTQS